MKLTLKEKLDHGDLDHVFSREEIEELYELLELEDTLAEAWEDQHQQGYAEGYSEGEWAGEENECIRIRDGYIEIREHRTEKDIKELLEQLDDYFEYTPPKPKLELV